MCVRAILLVLKCDIYFQNWAEEKANTPFGCLPVLTEYFEDGSKFQLGESHAIERYLARKFGLLGSNEQEAALIDSFGEGWSSLINTMAKARFGSTDAIKEAAEANFVTIASEIIQYHEKQLEKNGNGYYVGSKLSLIDILAYTTMHLMKIFGNDTFDNAPVLNKIFETVKNDPIIGAYACERLEAYTPN
ncbi:Glutathione S-transferase [Basidiobolus ranarum]|uniref:Glutathione S-transferase n=1 Tax=Basidiobolus ranarum TaxID=34480 RepID=A0ABR2W1G9_9FUNG